MEIYETFHFIVFLYSLLWGALVYLLYELFRCIRILFNNKFTVTVVCDLLFMINSALIVFVFSLTYNFGEIRIYMLIGFSASFILLRLTVGRVFTIVFLNLIRKIFLFFKKLMAKLLKSVLYLVYNLINKGKCIFKLKKGSNNG
jgi:hypothetical protein